jgi:hypothetical protein
MEGRDIQVVDWGQDSAAHPINVAANGAETINGVASVDIGTDGATAHIHCYGGEWKTLAPVT